MQEYIDSWEPDDEDDELDEEALWRPVRARWDAYPVLALNVEFGIQDKETEGFLERVQELISGDLLALLLPEGETASEQRPDLTDAPSTLCGYGKGGEAAVRMRRNIYCSDMPGTGKIYPPPHPGFWRCGRVLT